MNQEDSYLASLPLELVHRISRFLAPADIVKLSQTCRWLRAALNHDDVWNRYLPDGHTYLEETEQMAMKQVESDLASLPLELVHHVSQFLAPADVLSVSQTCRWLRVALNHNNVWKTYLPDRNITLLENMEQMVDPPLEIDSVISTLCSNRVHFIRKTRLLNNWKCQNFVESPSVVLPCDRIVPATFHQKKGSQVMYKDRFIFLARHTLDVIDGVFIDESDMIYALEVDVAPTLITSLLLEESHNGFHVAGDYLVVIIRLVACVYRINFPEPTLPLEYSFAVYEETVRLGAKADDPLRFPQSEWAHFFSGNYLMSSFCRRGDVVLHAWDLVRATKVGCFPSPILGGISMSLFSQFKNYCVFRQNQMEGQTTFFLFFDLENKQFARFACKFEGPVLNVIFHNESIVLFKNGEGTQLPTVQCLVWPLYFTAASNTPLNIQTLNIDEAAAKRVFETDGHLCGIQETIIVNGKFLIYVQTSIQVVDAKTLETLDIINLAKDEAGITHHCDVYGSLFVMSIGNFLRPDTKLWDVSKKISRDLRAVDDAYFNTSRTKIIIYVEPIVKVVHFW